MALLFFKESSWNLKRSASQEVAVAWCGHLPVEGGSGERALQSFRAQSFIWHGSRILYANLLFGGLVCSSVMHVRPCLSLTLTRMEWIHPCMFTFGLWHCMWRMHESKLPLVSQLPCRSVHRPGLRPMTPPSDAALLTFNELTYSWSPWNMSMSESRKFEFIMSNKEWQWGICEANPMSDLSQRTRTRNTTDQAFQFYFSDPTSLCPKSQFNRKLDERRSLLSKSTTQWSLERINSSHWSKELQWTVYLLHKSHLLLPFI